MRRAWAGFQRRAGSSDRQRTGGGRGLRGHAELLEPSSAVRSQTPSASPRCERGLSFAWEQSLQRAFLSVPELVEAMNVVYFVGHFDLTGVFFLWLYRSSSEGFAASATGSSPRPRSRCVIHWWFPTAPPRVARRARDHGHARVFWDVDIGSPTTSAFSNPVAAVPSLHAGWAVGVGVGLVRFAKQPALRVLGFVYPVVVDADDRGHREPLHFDALAGIAVPQRASCSWRSPRAGAVHWSGILERATRGGAVR